MKKLFILLTLCTFTLMTRAQSKDEMDVSAKVESLRKGMIDADEPMLSSIVSNELSYGHSSGALDTKASFIGNLVSKRSDFVTITLTDQTIKIVDNVAIVRHKLAATTNDGGNPGTVNLSVLLIWQKQGGEWKLIARQAVKIV